VSQFTLLRRAFFGRLFESDLMPEGLPQVQLVLWGALLAATPASGYAFLVVDKYASLQFSQPLAPEFAADRTILITLSMLAIGAAGLIIWDGVFPDRRDVRILGVLPVSTWRFVEARLAAVGQVYVLFAVPICVLQSVSFPLAVAGHGDPVPRLHGMGAHLATVVFACTFVFATLVAAQSLLLIAFGRRAAQHVSVAFQLLFAVGLVQLFFFLPRLGRVLREGGGTHEGLGAVVALPPTWFVGLYEALTGTGNAQSLSLARVAVVVTLAAVVLSIGLYAATYGPLSRRALEGPPPRARRHGWERLRHVARQLPLPGRRAPPTEAVRQYTVRTLARSRSHRMMLAIYAGIALAIVASSALSVAVRDGGAGLWRPAIPMLSMPLAFQFLLLIALRLIMALPCEPKARWIFRACEPSDRAAAVDGARDTMTSLVVLPTGLFALGQGLIFWTLPAAAGHAVFCWVMGRLFSEVLLIRMDKLPCACTYYPGKSRVFTLWPFYVLAFFMYTVLFAAIDQALIARPLRLVAFCSAVWLAARLVAWRRHRRLTRLTSLRFEEEDPDRIFQGFNLSEALAAVPRTLPQK